MLNFAYATYPQWIIFFNSTPEAYLYLLRRLTYVDCLSSGITSAPADPFFSYATYSIDPVTTLSHPRISARYPILIKLCNLTSSTTSLGFPTSPHSKEEARGMGNISGESTETFEGLACQGKKGGFWGRCHWRNYWWIHIGAVYEAINHHADGKKYGRSLTPNGIESSRLEPERHGQAIFSLSVVVWIVVELRAD